MLTLSPQEVDDFRETVWGHYRAHRREMPWREDPSPYKVVVSELMLQQTQVARVLKKFDAFLLTFPDFASLAHAPLHDVVAAWSGLGYNRRAKYLHAIACAVANVHHGRLPDNSMGLQALPGIGKNTAGAIMAYVYNQPEVFVETNIRTVLFHSFFNDSDEGVTDKELELLVAQTLDREHPREWYWALMDYGTHLKTQRLGRNQQSKHYKKQSKFIGSPREMRGRIVRELTNGGASVTELQARVVADERFVDALDGLLRDGLVVVVGDDVMLAK